MPGPLYLYIDIETAPSPDPSVVAEIAAQHIVAPLDLWTIIDDRR
jgi:hypothetical protein